MSDTVWSTINPVARDTSQDGLILDVNTTDLGNADTSYTYFDLLKAGFDAFSLSYVITATTLTVESTEDSDEYANSADEMISTTNDRSFAGAGNWASYGSGASVVVSAGVLSVTAGVALSGAKLSSDYFVSKLGLKQTRRYTVLLTIASLSAGTVSVYVGSQLLASGLGNGAAQSVSFQMRSSQRDLRVVASNAAATFTIDNVSVKPVAAVWRDVTQTLTDGAASSLTSTGGMTVATPEPMRRLRVKRVTTNATNALELRLTRMRS